jgi:hypothetical protein
MIATASAALTTLSRTGMLLLAQLSR